MRTRDRWLPLVLLSLALALPAGASAQDKAQSSPEKPRSDRSGGNEKNPYAERFKQLDRNGDGYVSPAEWPLDPPSFERVDRNKDGRLSRTELLTPNVLRNDRRDEQFQELDTNRDGRLSRVEQRQGGTGLGRLDRNRDGYVTRPEYGARTDNGENTWSSRSTVRTLRLFRDLDRNRDNRLNRVEWTGDETRFTRLDRNRDGVISPNEWPQ
ncbi:MAG TPA: EF-hand domain-containing protein [Thermoanaerobaculia bacterium]|nr:EF-hand domain-containing protein [Thermoanaerobaculia bacterium]